MVSRVGDDAMGAEIIRRLEALGVPTHCISVDAEHPTGTVTVELAGEGEPRFTIHEGVAWDHMEPNLALMSTLAGADAVCFGTLGQRCEPSRSTIRKLVANCPEDTVRVFDVNLRQDFYSREVLHDSLQFANVLKLNDVELPIVGRLLGVAGSPKEQMAALLRRYNLRLLACTRGANGSLLYNGTEWCERPGLQTDVRDTVGAGDSFTAAVTMGTLAGWDIEKISLLANEVAAFVCSCEGATPAMPEDIRARFGLKLNERSGGQGSSNPA